MTNSGNQVNFPDPDAGIHIQSDNNKVSHCDLSFNRAHGIFIQDASFNEIIDNKMYSNQRAGITIMSSSKNNLISHNFLNSNSFHGVWILYSSDDNIISDNEIANNEQYGIIIVQAYNNKVINNTISMNNDGGVYIVHSLTVNNQLYHNIIISNSTHAIDEGDNQWDNGYPEGGNFWSNYTGIDLNSTPSQDTPPPDGIGDTPYNIDSDTKDNYPLMKPFEKYLFLYEGWNLISIPYIQTDINLGTVLTSIIGLYDAVQQYNGTDINDHWKHNNTAKPPHLNDLNTLDHTMGFWIHITESNRILYEYPGTPPTSNQTIQLHPGWNLMGYPSLSNHNRTVGLNNLEFGVDVDAIQWYDAATKTWHFMGHDDSFVPGRGYWMHSKVDTTWEVPI
jgi:parallel beta-helix repeat protein